jgi:zona occludens toxin
MIIIYEGVPGSGKSYDAIRVILHNLKLKRKIYTNIDGIELPECQEYIAQQSDMTRVELSELLEFIPRQKIQNFYDYVDDGSLIVIDEAQLFFNSRDFSKQHNREFADWSSTHRHKGFDVILITQRAERIDTAVRSLCDFRYRYRKLNFMGPATGYIQYIYIGDDPKHMSYNKKSYDPKIFPAYKSYIGNAKEKEFHKRPNIFKHPVFIAIPIAFIVAIYFGSKGSLFVKNSLAGHPLKDKNPIAVTSINSTGVTASQIDQVRERSAIASAPANQSQEITIEKKEVQLELFPVSAFITMKGNKYLQVYGVLLHDYDFFDEENLVVGIQSDLIPPALALKIRQMNQSMSINNSPLLEVDPVKPPS